MTGVQVFLCHQWNPLPQEVHADDNQGALVSRDDLQTKNRLQDVKYIVECNNNC